MDLQDIYPGPQPPRRYTLRSMACYYGQHYFAFVLLPGAAASAAPRWVLLDDARLTPVGGWDEVLRRCEEGRIQPSVLFYVSE